MKKTITYFLVVSNFLVFLNIVLSQENLIKPIPKGVSHPAPVIQSPQTFTDITSTIIFQETFEAGATGWSTSGSWAIGTPTSGPNSGYNSVRCAATNLSGNYPNNASDWLISPNITLTSVSSASQFSLRLMEWFSTESGYDYGYVKISTNGGSTWTSLSTRHGSSNWREFSIDLTSYSNRQIKIAFHFTSDGSVSYSGWYVDNVQITRDDPEPITATMTSLNSQNFPFVYMNIAVDTFGVGFSGLTQSNFIVYENNVLQTDYFQIVPPDTGAGVRLADIIFVLDVTGSMSEEISAVKNNMLNFVNSLSASGINYGIGVVVFGDIVYTYNSGNLYYNQSQILSIINNITLGENGIGSGGDEPENQLGAMYAATLMNFRPGAQRIQIMMTDAHAHESNSVTTWTVSSLIPILQAANITIYPVFDINDSQQRTQYIPIAQATNTMGTYFHIYNNFIGIINEIQSSIANSYVIRYRSSNPTFDGTTRNVNVIVTYRANSDTATGTYVPGSAPLIQRTSSTLALHNQPWAEGTTFNIEADIVDNVSPYVQSARLYYRRTGTTTYSSVAMTLQSGTRYRGVIPSSAVRTPGLDYYITATDGISTSSDPRTDPANNPYQFAILPNVAPAITHTPVSTLTPGSPITVTATIVDNTNSLAIARLYYRKTGQLLYQQVTMTNIGGNNYQAVIPAAYVTVDGVDYYIYAADNFGVSSTHGTTDRPHKIEPEYILKRPSITGTEPFQLSIHSWRFDNSRGNMWPPDWWSQFNYCQYPYPQGWCGTPANDFPDWPLFVEAFGENQCYLSPPPGVVIYNPIAVAKWFALKGEWGGSCFGFSTSSLLFFDNRLSLADTFGVTTLNRIQDGNFNGGHSRRFINRYFLYQYTLSRLTHILLYRFRGPMSALNDIKRMFLSSDHDNRTLSIIGRTSDGKIAGHSVVPYKVTTGESVDTIFIYENNWPNMIQRITVNKNSNVWRYPDDPFWVGGSNGLFLMDPISSYTSRPGLLKGKNHDVVAQQSVSSAFVQFFNTSNFDIIIKNPQGDSLGYKSGQEIISMPNSIPIIPLTGKAHPPIGYLLSPNDYSFRLWNCTDSNLYVSGFSDSAVVFIRRAKVRPTEVDKLLIGRDLRSSSISNSDSATRVYSLEYIVSEADSFKVLSVNRYEMSFADSVHVRITQASDMVISSRGGLSKFDLFLKSSSPRIETIFEHRNIQVTPNSNYRIEPSWLDMRRVPILRDLNLDGIWDDTLFVDNEYTGGSPLTPGPLSTENVYAYPNPFNPESETAKFRFKLGKDGNMTITVFDVTNTKVKEVITNVPMSAGVEQSIQWDGRNERGNIVANGVYFYVIESSSGERAVGKIAVLR